jgi:DNA topoisomerase VI subunit B
MTVRELVSRFGGLTATAKQKAVCAAAGLTHARLSDLAKDNAPDMSAAARLLEAMQDHSRLVKPAELGVIGKDAIASRFAALGYEAQSFKYAKAETKSSRPSIIETAFAWCPGGERTLITGVNWSPGILNPFRQLAYQSLDTILAQQRVHYEEPVALLVHIATPRPNYSDRGKSSVVLAEPQPIINLVTKVTKTWAKQLKAEERHARHIRT